MKKILLVDDTKGERKKHSKSIKKSFNDEVEIDLAENGAKAVEKVEQGNQYDIIIMDIQMPIMNGIQAAQKIKALGFTKPIIAHTSLGFIEAEQAMLEGKMDGFVVKKSNPATLIRLIASHIGITIVMEKKKE